MLIIDLYLKHEYERQDAICGALLACEELEVREICEKCERRINKERYISVA